MWPLDCACARLCQGGHDLGALLALALLGAALGACRTYRAAERAPSELVGFSTQQLLSCAGAPDKRATAGNVEVLTYAVRLEDPETGTHYCEVSFVLTNGKVTKVNYTGTTGLISGHAHCGRAVKNCLR